MPLAGTDYAMERLETTCNSDDVLRIRGTSDKVVDHFHNSSNRKFSIPPYTWVIRHAHSLLLTGRCAQDGAADPWGFSHVSGGVALIGFKHANGAG